MVVGIVAVAVSAALFIFFGGKKKKNPVTLIESEVKYPLKLVDKEVRSYYSNKQIAVYVVFLLLMLFMPSQLKASSPVR